jgi:hypothetical protein
MKPILFVLSFLLVASGNAQSVLISPWGQSQTDLITVWNLDGGSKTAQGGDHRVFVRPPSRTSIQLVPEERRGEDGRSMKISYKKEDAGFCGVWFHLFDDKAKGSDRKLLDVSKDPYLSFWVKGAKGGEDFEIQLADLEWLNKDDSRSAGLATTYLKGPITTEWQEVVVPVADFLLDSNELATFTLNFTAKGEGVVYIDDINFKKTKTTSVPKTKLKLVDTN